MRSNVVLHLSELGAGEGGKLLHSFVFVISGSVMLAVSTIPRRIPLSKREIAEFSRSFRRDARERGFSARTTDRYEAWVLAFVSWCWEHEPGHVRPDRLGSFQTALQDCPDTDDSRVGEAMDALAFLFGSATNAHSVLAATGVYDEEGASLEPVDQRQGRPTDIQTLQVGWRGPKDADENASGAPSRSDETPDRASRPARRSEGEQEDASSTAELCIQRYQDQIESLHRRERGKEGRGKQ